MNNLNLKEKNHPIELFDQWYKEAEKMKVEEPEAVNLATATKEGKPSNRMVLLKKYDNRGFVFYTNLESRKGLELGSNPYAAMCFYWKEIDRQIRIEGKIDAVSTKEADDYFASRPLISRIGALLSKQSRPLENNFDLLKEVSKKSTELAIRNIERPNFWSGFRLIPERIEFWKRGDFRIHQRKLYQLDKNQEWQISYLYP